MEAKIETIDNSSNSRIKTTKVGITRIIMPIVATRGRIAEVTTTKTILAPKEARTAACRSCRGWSS